MNSRIKSNLLDAVLFLASSVVILLMGATIAVAEDSDKYEAEFTADGHLIRPAGWREWVFVGSPLTPNSLNGGEAPFPEFHSVYIDPASWEHYKKTGEFREGTMFAKELTLIGATAATSGVGFFNGDLQGFEIAHKDSRRYSKDSGGWAYYSFGHKPEPYANSTAAQPTACLRSVSHGSSRRRHGFYPILSDSEGCQGCRR